MRPIQLSRENEKRKKTLKRKVFKTKQEKEEYKLLSGKIAKDENTYERNYRALMANRPAVQKKFNTFYEKKERANNLVPKQLYIPQSIGIYQHPENERAAIDEEALLIPEESIPMPDMTRAEADMVKGYRDDDPERTPMKFESQSEVELRTAPFLFGLWFTKKTGEESPYTNLIDIPDDLFEEFVGQVNAVKNNPNDYPLLFGKTDSELKQFIELHEIGAPDERVHTTEIGRSDRHFFTKLVTKDGETKISIPGAIGAGRYLANLSEGKKFMMYFAEFIKYRCGTALEEDIPAIKPLTTFKSSGCLTIFNGVKSAEKYLQARFPNELLFKNWIVLRKEFKPFRQEFGAIFAFRFFDCSFILDALENWGLIGMDPSFYTFLRAKFPRILYANSSYIVKDKEFARFYEAVFRPDSHENFLVLDSKFYTRPYELSLENPFVKSEENTLYETFQKALDQAYLYGMTPYMAYTMKKINPDMWNKFLFQGRDMRKHTRQWEDLIKQNNLVYFNQLTPREKIIIDYLQFLRFLEVLQDGYNFAKARDTYKDLLSDDEVKSELLELYTEENPESRDMMTHLQSIATPRERPASFYMSREDVKSILDKFKTILRIRIPPSNNNNNNNSVAVVNVRPRVSEPPILSLRAPVEAPRSQVDQIRSRLAVLRNERTALERDSTVYNSVTKKRRARGNVNKQYANLERVQRTRGEKQKIQVKRAAVKAKYDRLEALNRNIHSLEQQLSRLVPLPSSPRNTGAGVGLTPRTGNSTSPNLPLAAAVLGNL